MHTGPHERLLNGRYELHLPFVSEAGRRVWRALDCLLGRTVVVKGAICTPNSPEARAVVDEYRRLSQLRHPRFAMPFDLGWAKTLPHEPAEQPFVFFTQEYISGPSLRELSGRLPLAELRDCLKELLEVVASLHRRKLICLDLKPVHVLKGETGWRFIDLDQAKQDDPLSEVELSGTVSYLAPEVLLGTDVDARSDLYSVGALIWEALTGAPPALEGSSVEQVRGWLKNRPPIEVPERAHLEDPEFARAVRALLSSEPEGRPESAEEALALLRGATRAGLDSISLPESPSRVGLTSAPLQKTHFHIGPAPAPLPETHFRIGPASAPLPETHLLGRDAELDRARQLDKARTAENGGLIRVRGPEGSGRSRFSAALSFEWQAAGRPAFLFQDNSLQPFSGMSGQAFSGVINLVLGHLSALRGIPTRAITTLGSTGSTGSERDPRESWASKVLTELRDQGREAARAAGAPIPILIDESEPLDELSELVLDRLEAHLPDSGLLLLRTITLPASESKAHPNDSDIDLSPLSSADLRAHCEEIFGPGSVSREEVDHLHIASGGWIGSLREALWLKWSNPDFSLLDWSPTATESSRHALLASLPEDILPLVQALSVLDGPFTRALLETTVRENPALGRSAWSSLKQAEAYLVDTGILVAQPAPEGGETTLRFAREPVRRSVLDELPETRRQEAHRLAAEALERQGPSEPLATAETIASQFLAAGLPERARPHLLRAYRSSPRGLRPIMVARTLRRLVEITEAEDPELVDFLVTLGETEYALGRFALAREAFSKGLEAAREGTPRYAQCHGGLGRALAMLGQPEKAREALETALESGLGVGLYPRVTWWHGLVWLGITGNDAERARTALESAEKEGIPKASELAIRQARYAAWLALVSRDVSASLLRRLEEALELARRLEDIPGEMDILNLMTQAFQLAGDLQAARAHAEQMLRRSHEVFDLTREAPALVNLGYIQRALRLSHEALASFERSAQLQLQLGNRRAEARSLLAAADLMLEFPQFVRAEPLLNRVQELCQEGSVGELGARHWLELLTARLKLRQGELDGLEATFAEIRAKLKDLCYLDLALAVFADQMELAFRQGDLDRALELYQEIPKSLMGLSSLASWWRVHDLTSRIHRQLAPLGPGPEVKEGSSLAGSAAPSPTRALSTSSTTPPTSQALSTSSTTPPTSQALSTSSEAPSPSQALSTSSTGSASKTGNGRETASVLDPPSSSRLAPTETEGAVDQGSSPGQELPGALDSQSEMEAPHGLIVSTRSAHDSPSPLASNIEWLDWIRRLLELTDEDDLLAAELARLAGRMVSGRGLVFIFDEGRPETVRGYNMTEAQVDDISRSIIEKVRIEGRPYMCEDIRFDQRMGQIRSLRDAGVQTVICCPVLNNRSCVGVIYVDRRAGGQPPIDQATVVVERVAELAVDLLLAIKRRRQALNLEPGIFGLVGESKAMQELRKRIAAIRGVDDPDLTVLLLGETGTGKSTVARALYEHGSRASAPFHTTDCAAVPQGLFEALMFGTTKNVFNGAENRPGWFEMANHGTLFLDEIGEMPLEQQAKLLSTLSSRRTRRLGGAADVELDVHVIFATNRELMAEAEAGRFRQDLLRRIHVNAIRVPSLKERGAEDIRLLAKHMITQYLKTRGVLDPEAELVRLRDYLTPHAVNFLTTYDWPWNVGEMENLFKNEMLRLRFRTLGEEKVNLENVREALGSAKRLLPSHLSPRNASESSPKPSSMAPDKKRLEPEALELPPNLSYQELTEFCEKIKGQYVRKAFEECDGKVLTTARKLNTVRDVVRRYAGR